MVSALGICAGYFFGMVAKPLLSRAFWSWAKRYGIPIEEVSSDEVVLGERHVVRADGDEWIVGGVRDRDGAIRSPYRVRRGPDLERLLYLYFGNTVRMRKSRMVVYFGPGPARGWRVTKAGVFDADGRLRMEGRVPGEWGRDELTRLWTYPTPVVARAAVSRSGWPLRERTWNQLLFRVAIVLLIAAGIVVGNVGGNDTVVTVAFFVVTVPAVVYVGVATAIWALFAAAQSDWWLPESLGAVIVAAGLGAVVIEVAAMWLAAGTPGVTWYYPFAAVAVIGLWVAVVVGVGVVVERLIARCRS